MEHSTEVFVGIDVSKLRNAIAVADGERGGELRYLGEIDASDVNRRGNLPPYRRRILTPAWGIDPTAAERWCGAAAVGSMVAEVRRGS